LEFVTHDVGYARLEQFALRASVDVLEKYHAAGWWRDSGLIADLRRWRDATPDAVAIDAFGAHGERTTVTYRRYAHLVERYAGALRELGVRPGDVVAMQLPNWWQACALYLAVTRLRAVLAPVMTTLRRRELELLLARVGASVFVTVDSWDGFDHAGLARSSASMYLPLQTGARAVLLDTWGVRPSFGAAGDGRPAGAVVRPRTGGVSCHSSRRPGRGSAST
jgi:non-ribosomal peptide synthetase component E (peptide arylation enzyme)